MRIRIFLLFVIVALGVFQAACRRGNDAGKDRPVVAIIGLDGADWRLIDPLIAKGRLPLFKQLKEEAAWGWLRTLTPAKSPVVWTSIATGKTMDKHGIRDFRATRVNRRGKHPLASSLDIREPLIWEMLGSRNLRSVLVNWYLSFPPQPFNGVNVSDFFNVSAIGASEGEKLRQTVFPAERAAGLAKMLDRDYASALERTGIPDYPSLFEERSSGNRYSDVPVFKGFSEFLIEECITEDTAAYLFRSENFDFFAVYFELADKVQHFAYMSFVDDAYKKLLNDAAPDGELPEAAAEEAYARIAEIVCPVYQNMERILRAYFAAARGRNLYFIIASDHGFSFFVRDGQVRYNHIGQEKAPDGMIVVRGPGVRPGKIRQARIYDIAPTVLYLLGLPLDRSMDGIPLRRLFAPRREQGYTVYRKDRASVRAGDSGVEDKKLQELKALGYIN